MNYTPPMFLGGLQRHSLIDYPGRISCTCFFSGCNFRCPYCHNPGLVNSADPYPRIVDNDFFVFLETRKGLLDGVVLSGGEPTLQEHLRSFCERVKAMGFSVKLDTNGSSPQVIRDLLERGLLDYIAMDLKTGPEEYEALMSGRSSIQAIRESIQVVMESGLEYEFRTTCVKPFVDKNIMGRMTPLIQGARRYVLQPFRKAGILDPDYFQGQEPGHTPEEMKELKAVAEPHVMECFIRG
jgi:pyruvate formate lyase activating enzyme